MSSVLSRRSTQPHEQRGLTRRAILDATGRLLGDGKAFAELSVGEISAQAGVSRPTFYAYFSDKRALILSLATEFEQDARDAARSWLNEEHDDLRGTLEGVLTAFTTHRNTVGAVVEAATYDKDVAEFWRSFHEWFVISTTRRALAADAALHPEAAEALAYSLVWMTERCFTEHLCAQRFDTTALLDALQRLWHTVIPA